MTARAEILARANRHRRDRMNRDYARTGRFVFALKPLTMRHIDEAVCIARRNGLVSSEVLVAAGFRAAAPGRIFEEAS